MVRRPPGIEVEHLGSGGCSSPGRLESEVGGAPMKVADPSRRNSLRSGAAEGRTATTSQRCGWDGS